MMSLAAGRCAWSVRSATVASRCSCARGPYASSPKRMLMRPSRRLAAGMRGSIAACGQQPLGRGDHERRIDARQAAEIAGLADTLVARPARQPINLDEL